MFNCGLNLNYCSDEEKILWMAGTHGSEDGKSALTDIDMIDDDGHGFYQEDCRAFGIKAGPRRSKARRDSPLSEEKPFSNEDWKKLPTITKLAEKLESPPQGSPCNDKLMKKMDIRVAHMTYFYKNKEKLIRDINKECLINKQLI